MVDEMHNWLDDDSVGKHCGDEGCGCADVEAVVEILSLTLSYMNSMVEFSRHVSRLGSLIKRSLSS